MDIGSRLDGLRSEGGSMTLSVYGNPNAIAANLSTFFGGAGGTAPYTFSLQAGPNAAGGTINAVTGKYTSPALVPTDPAKQYDTVIVTDATLATATRKIMVATPLLLLCDIIKTQMNISDDHIYLWDQKIFQPTDSDLYIAVGILSSTPFGNTNEQVAVTGGFESVQSINMLDRITIDLISRSSQARERRAEILMALNSNYAESQQELNSFFVGKLPAAQSFVNLSSIDGAAIPYRFQISINLQYFVTLSQPVQYFEIDVYQQQPEIDTDNP